MMGWACTTAICIGMEGWLCGVLVDLHGYDTPRTRTDFPIMGWVPFGLRIHPLGSHDHV